MAKNILNQKAFTLIEVLAVMVIMSTLASVGTHKFGMLSETASYSALQITIEELNGREALIWFNIKLTPADWKSDEELFAHMDTKIGQDYQWNPPADKAGGTLHFRNQQVFLKRKPSTTSLPGRWYTEQ